MAQKRLLDLDPETGTTEWYIYDDALDQVTIHTVQDVGPILEANKARYAMTDERANWKGDWHRVGQVPLSVWQNLPPGIKWSKDQKAMKRWWNDSDNLLFRTRPGRI